MPLLKKGGIFLDFFIKKVIDIIDISDIIVYIIYEHNKTKRRKNICQLMISERNIPELLSIEMVMEITQ